MIRKEILAIGVALLAVLFLVSVPTVLAQDFCEADMNYDGYVQFNDLKIIKAEYNRDDCPPDGPAPVPKTGNTSADYSGNDGDLKKGVAWPNPRFTDNEDETITDNLTGLMWTKDANLEHNNCLDIAIAYVATMNSGAGTYGYTDWRVPNVRELQSLIQHNYTNPALPDTTGLNRWAQGNPFIDVQSEDYRTSTGAPSWPWAWYLDLNDGATNKHFDYDWDSWTWPVRGGH